MIGPLETFRLKLLRLANGRVAKARDMEEYIFGPTGDEVVDPDPEKAAVPEEPAEEAKVLRPVSWSAKAAANG